MPPLPEEKALGKARSSLLRLLSYRGRSRCEAEAYLRGKGFDSAVVSAVLEEMERWRYIDDRRFAADYIESSLRRGWGPLRVRYALLSKGVSRELLDPILEQRYSPEDEESLARRVLAKRAPTDGGEEKGRVRRQIAYLQRRGFHDGVIIRIMQEKGPFDDD